MRYGNIIYENAFRSDYNTMKYDTSIYRGVFCALNAIYDENDNINTDAIKALVDKIQTAGGKRNICLRLHRRRLFTEHRGENAGRQRPLKRPPETIWPLLYTSEPRPQRKRAFWHAMPKK